MKIKVVAQELLDSSIEFVSLVKNGATRAPFKILKEDENVSKRNEKRDALLAKRDQPRIVGSNWQAVQKTAQRAADVGLTAVMKAPIGQDEAIMDFQAGRYGSDPLQQNTPAASRGFWENFAALGDHFREIAAMLRKIGQAEAADALETAVSNIAKSNSITDEEAGLLMSISSRYSGSRDLDWLEDQGRQMQERNAELANDRSLSSLDESITAKPRDAGVKKADAGDDVLDSAFDSGLGVSGRYR